MGLVSGYGGFGFGFRFLVSSLENGTMAKNKSGLIVGNSVVKGDSVVGVSNNVSSSNGGNGVMNKKMAVELNPDRLRGNGGENQIADSLKANQQVADQDGFSHVAKIWYDKCMSFDELATLLGSSRGSNHDLYVPTSKLELRDDNGKLKLEGAGFDSAEISPHCLSQIGSPQVTGLGNRMLSIAQDNEETELLNRLYVKRFNEWKRSFADHRQSFIRFREDTENGNTIRALLSDRYVPVKHELLLEIIEETIGRDTRISHFDAKRFMASGGDIIRFNALIPDAERVETDSGYGGMVSVSNSEIGTGRWSTLPGLFRYICMNGNVWSYSWDAKFKFSGVHKGNGNLQDLKQSVKKSIFDAIPLWNGIAESFLQLQEIKLPSERELRYAIQRVVAYCLKEKLGATKKDIALVIGGDFWFVEDHLDSAMGVVNVLTRYSQTLGIEQSQNIDIFAGSLTHDLIGDKREKVWRELVRGADKLTGKDNGLFADVLAV